MQHPIQNKGYALNANVLDLFVTSSHMFTYKNIRKTQVTIHATVFQFSAKAILAK
jgi:hypothetical protein